MNQKLYNIKYQWQWLKLTPEEANKLSEEAEIMHDLQMGHCISRARKLLGCVCLCENIIHTAIALFEKEATPTAFIKEDALDKRAIKLIEG